VYIIVRVLSEQKPKIIPSSLYYCISPHASATGRALAYYVFYSEFILEE
jgi:hypothetical protein